MLYRPQGVEGGRLGPSGFALRRAVPAAVLSEGAAGDGAAPAPGAAGTGAASGRAGHGRGIRSQHGQGRLMRITMAMEGPRITAEMMGKRPLGGTETAFALLVQG